MAAQHAVFEVVKVQVPLSSRSQKVMVAVDGKERCGCAGLD